MEKEEDKKNLFEADPTIPVSCTLYINNLDQSIKPNRIRDSLNTVFGAYGNVLQVCVRKSLKMRGQAFVIYDTKESAQFAMESLQNHELFDRPMHINYSKIESDITVKNQGKEITREKKPKQIKVQIEKTLEHKEEVPIKQDIEKKEPNEIKLPPNSPTRHTSNRLFIKSVPQNVSKQRLEELFKQQEGFVEVRYIVIKGNAVAFIEFKDETSSEHAIQKGIGQSEGIVLQFAN
ncbi:U1 small nuclear ribonucleoprotein A, putative [Entamoeba dispar SAW760]|uniref:U1 small nuclear ribonucleoprotein A, putative n=1 Tax=Entamoeba dispar (strain ATCC PRA-260 / SAW760) TaxID=370354 RepID=B0EAT2_ENTDS|nr:U1 small nuclear ribonucleoprotein A, putative [Entamoeba dispar SAW760]EDR28371.1 U1 small nuclear ribonucleoprotein A, putative [Entamoeba dispar SAW760]|eukprot:EDR28371.1 U1 small nuclear ribonucleoprotein A, putative [Entamoeba dispar SAW760]